MAVDFEDAFDYPTRGEDTLKRFLIGGGIPAVLAVGYGIIMILSLLFPLFYFLTIFLMPFALAIGLVLVGYYVRVVRTTYAGEDEPPSFGEWKGLLKDGAYGFLISIIYSIPTFLLGAVGVVMFFVIIGGGAAFGGDSGGLFAAMGLLSILLFGVLMLLYMAYALVMGYLFPISLCIYADTGSIKSAFSWSRLTTMATEKDYAIAWIAQAGALFAFQSIAGLLSMVLIGYLLYPLLPFVSFFVMTAAYYVFAQTYDDAIGAGDVDLGGVETVDSDLDDDDGSVAA